jgi:hypothetical protein
LVSVERVFAGLVPPPPADGGPLAVPYVALERLDDAAQVRTSSHRSLSVEILRMHVVAASLAAARSIAEEAQRHFSRFGVDLAEGVIQDMRLLASHHAPIDQGLWRATLAWQVRVARDLAASA